MAFDRHARPLAIDNRRLYAPRHLLAIAVQVALCLDPVDIHAGSPPTPHQLWLDLTASEVGRVARAVLQLSTRQEETVAFLKSQLRAVMNEPARVAVLISDLGSEEFATRDKATLELEYYGKYIKDDLQKALEERSDVSPRPF